MEKGIRYTKLNQQNIETLHNISGAQPIINRQLNNVQRLPSIVIFNYNEDEFKNRNNFNKEKNLNIIANLAKKLIDKKEYDLVVVCSQNSLLRTKIHIQHIISEKLKNSKYELLSKMSINKKNMLNYLFKNNRNVRTRVWYNKDKITLQNDAGFNVNMKNNKNNKKFSDNKSKNFSIRFIEREKIYPIDIKKIKEGIGINYIKIIISDKTDKEYEFIIVNSNPSLIQNVNIPKTNKPKNKLFKNKLSLKLISNKIKLGNNNKINLIHISTNGIEYKKLPKNIDYFNLTAIQNVQNDKHKIFIMKKIKENIKALIEESFNQNKKIKATLTQEKINELEKKFISYKILINTFGYLINEKNLINDITNETTKEVTQKKVIPLTQEDINNFNEKHKLFKKFIEDKKKEKKDKKEQKNTITNSQSNSSL